MKTLDEITEEELNLKLLKIIPEFKKLLNIPDNVIIVTKFHPHGYRKAVLYLMEITLKNKKNKEFIEIATNDAKKYIS